MVVECGGYLNKPLKKSLLGRRRIEPDFLPGFVSLKKMLGIKKSYAVREKLRVGLFEWLGRRGMLHLAISSRARGFGFRGQDTHNSKARPTGLSRVVVPEKGGFGESATD